MTREEIKNTPELVDFMLDKCILADSRTKVRKRLEEVCDLAIKALEQQPVTTTNNDEPITIIYPTIVCDDAISREAVFNAIERESEWLLAVKSHNGLTEIAFSGLRGRIDALSSVTPQQKNGRWEKAFDEHSYWYRCSCCGEKIPKNYWGHDYFSPYCPECGAKMQESDIKQSLNYADEDTLMPAT